MSKFRLIYFVLLISSLGIFPIQSQDPPSEKEQIAVSVSNIGHAVDGSLVLCVRIKAKKSEELRLFGKAAPPPPGMPAGIMPVPDFSLAESYLVDSFSGKKLAALPRLPRKPFFGPMTLASRLGPGGWIEMGVAFPKPPTPPLDKFGKPQDYKLLLHVPLDAEPTLVTFPITS